MPVETQAAVNNSLSKIYTWDDGREVIVSADTPTELVWYVREYFNANAIVYDTFSYLDLIPYLG